MIFMSMNTMIADRILDILKKQGKKQADLADSLGMSRQIISKMMNGSRTISAIELKKIADYLHMSMDELMKFPVKTGSTDVIHVFMGRVKTQEAREAIEIADRVSDLILFHNRIRENAEKRYL